MPVPLLSLPMRALAEPPPEITTLRLFENTVTCLAPQYVAQELLRGEGFTDVRYIKWPSETKRWPPELLLSGEADISLSFVPTDIIHIDAGRRSPSWPGATSAASKWSEGSGSGRLMT